MFLNSYSSILKKILFLSNTNLQLSNSVNPNSNNVRGLQFIYFIYFLKLFIKVRSLPRAIGNCDTDYKKTERKKNKTELPLTGAILSYLFWLAKREQKRFLLLNFFPFGRLRLIWEKAEEEKKV